MARKQPAIDAILPLSPRVTLILWALADGPQHPYRLLSLTEQLGRGKVAIGPASLYEAIHALEKKGLIEACASPERVGADDARRRYFRLTKFGRAALEAEASRIVQLSADLRSARLAGDPS